MADHSIRYRICCIEESCNKFWVLAADAAAPTTCPTDSEHEVSLASVTIVADPYEQPVVKYVLDDHADNAAAKTAGLVNGDFYKTGDLVKVVHD